MESKFELGQMVISKAGHDKGKYYIILQKEEEYLYLVDGKYKKTDCPKRKNQRHVEVVKESFPIINVTNEAVKKMIKEFTRNKNHA